MLRHCLHLPVLYVVRIRSKDYISKPERMSALLNQINALFFGRYDKVREGHCIYVALLAAQDMRSQEQVVLNLNVNLWRCREKLVRHTVRVKCGPETATRGEKGSMIGAA